MHADFTNQRKGKAARLIDRARALGTAIAKMGGRLAAWVDAWLLALAHPVPAGLMPVCLRSGWMGWTVLPPPAPAPSAGAKPLLNPAADSLSARTPMSRQRGTEPLAEGPPFGLRLFGPHS